jgi:hypothetical protein
MLFYDGVHAYIFMYVYIHTQTLKHAQKNTHAHIVVQQLQKCLYFFFAQTSQDSAPDARKTHPSRQVKRQPWHVREELSQTNKKKIPKPAP